MDRSTASTGSMEAVLNQMVHGFGTLLVVYDKTSSPYPNFGSILQQELR